MASKWFVGGKPITAEPVEFRMTSTPMFNTPGMLAWALNGYKFKRDRKQLLAVFTEGYPGPAPACYDALLQGQIPFTVDDEEAVIFTGWKEAA